jgi:hypothetical protein
MSDFLLFAGDDYYPLGGWRDFQGRYDTEIAAFEALASVRTADWWHIVECPGGQIVRSSKRD